jgi:hypothetical protein
LLGRGDSYRRNRMLFTVFATAPVSRRAFSAFLLSSTRRFFDECAVTAKRDDPTPPFPDGEELQRLLEGAAKHQIYLFEQE